MKIPTSHGTDLHNFTVSTEKYIEKVCQANFFFLRRLTLSLYAAERLIKNKTS